MASQSSSRPKAISEATHIQLAQIRQTGMSDLMKGMGFFFHAV